MPQDSKGRRCCTWTKEETQILADMWGSKPVKSIAERLGRTPGAVTLKASKLRLGRFLDNGDYVTLSSLIRAVKGYTGGNAMDTWTRCMGLKVQRKTVRNNKFSVVKLEDFWQWAFENRSKLDFSRMEPGALGYEPEWVEQQRRKDLCQPPARQWEQWTTKEQKKLEQLVRTGRYGYVELSAEMGRSCGALYNKLKELGLLEHIVRRPAHDGDWTEPEIRILEDGIRNGTAYYYISLQIGRSEKAVRKKVYNTFLTESMDKARKLLGDGRMRDVVVIPTVGRGRWISSTRHRTKRELEGLVRVLEARKAQMQEQYAEYFQRARCANWDSMEAQCAYGGECDGCSEFAPNDGMKE